MKFLKKFLPCILLVLTGLFISTANAQSVYQANTEVELVSEVTSIQPGRPFGIALRMKMDPHWHVYWKNPGDSGMAPRITWDIPEGFQVGEIQWPFPQRIEIPPLTSYGYEGEVFLLIPVTASSNIEEGQTIDLKAKLEWLACEIECVPGRADLQLSLLVLNSPPKPNPALASPFAITKHSIPGKDIEFRLGTDVIEVSETDTHFRIFLPGVNTDFLLSLQFFPESDKVINHSAQQVLTKSSEGATLKLEKSDLIKEPVKRLRGVLVPEFRYSGRNPFQPLEIDVPIQIIETNSESSDNLWLAIVFAFLGGLMLNLMPCVLPVLSIKILNLVEISHGQRKSLMIHGLMLTFGIVFTFWLLNALILILKHSGKVVGWGFQFQSPIFLIVMAVIFVWFALSMFGFFDIGKSLTKFGNVKVNQYSYRGSFFKGMLAAIVSTPCTAPFMGTALGFALVNPPKISFLIFTSLGFGLSAPLMFFSTFPQLLHWIPKPGQWMVNLKRFFGVLFLVTALWLIWVLASQQGWLPQKQQDIVKESKIAWIDYSPRKVEQLIQEGRPTFIDFTAKWCINCQVNERITLNNPKVVEAFRKYDIVAVKADWTNYDPAITQALAAFGKSSIPFYVLYTKDTSQLPVTFPEILTPGIVLNIFEENLVE